TLPIENPSTGEVMGRLAAGTAADVDDAVRAASTAFHGGWGRTTAVERGRILARMGREVEARIDLLSELEALDVGKP
ncbi:aldehyde dehydrogenase family protein, partial [Acinetobacter baumannii]